jgi:Ca2+-binding EF-hand superfamily protein
MKNKSSYRAKVTVVGIAVAGTALLGACSAAGEQDAATAQAPTQETTAPLVQPAEPTKTDLTEASGEISLSGDELLAAFGAQGREGVTEAELAQHRMVFNRIDRDGNGDVSADEYVAAGHFPEETARAINGGQDFDDSGGVSVKEYVEHRIQTDEGKQIHEGLDTDGDGSLTVEELVAADVLPKDQARTLFTQTLDLDGSGSVSIPEWLGTWGTWVWGDWIGPK